MIPLVFDKGPWTPADQVNFQNFLRTETGQRMLLRLAYSRPEYKSASSIEERAITSAKVEGYETAVSELLKLHKENDNA